MALTCPSVAAIFFAFAFLTPCSSHYSQWLTEIAKDLWIPFWYVNILFDWLKSIPMTCITVAGSIFAFSPVTLAGPAV